MIVTSMAQTVARSQAMDILPPIVSPKAEIFIKAIKDEEIYWSLFLADSRKISKIAPKTFSLSK